MNLDLEGKRAFITGSTRGIGYGIAKTLYHEGCHVILNGRDADRLETAALSLPGSKTVKGDVSCPEQAKKVLADVVSDVGDIDILICNVGSGRSVAPGEETYDEWQRVFGLNFWSATNVIEAARESLIATQGVVVCISSICGLEVIPNAPVTYSVAKAALQAYVRAIARPLGQSGVRINAVAPGNILFEDSIWKKKLSEMPEDVYEMLNREVALKKLGTVEDVSMIVAYLASSKANFVTGSTWTADGGQVHT